MVVQELMEFHPTVWEDMSVLILLKDLYYAVEFPLLRAISKAASNSSHREGISSNIALETTVACEVRWRRR